MTVYVQNCLHSFHLILLVICLIAMVACVIGFLEQPWKTSNKSVQFISLYLSAG